MDAGVRFWTLSRVLWCPRRIVSVIHYAQSVSSVSRFLRYCARAALGRAVLSYEDSKIQYASLKMYRYLDDSTSLTNA